MQQAAATLAAAWLEACGGLVQLLQHLNVQEHRGLLKGGKNSMHRGRINAHTVFTAQMIVQRWLAR